MLQSVLIWMIAALATACVIIRPFRLPEAIWAVLGATALVAGGLLPWRSALHAAGKGSDVYLFLTGMMLLSELARQEGLFDWVAARAARYARGSASRLFLLIYAIGTMVTCFLSNDATAVVLTPAVLAAARAARAADPLPFLYVCAFIANAASFLLPISNPANLVLYASRTPPLSAWFAQYAAPSAVAILVTYAMLRLTQTVALRAPIAPRDEISQPALRASGIIASCGLALTAILLLTASARGWPLGPPTALAGMATCAVVLIASRSSPLTLLRGVSWAVLPLVAGLFVLVEAVSRTGILRPLAALLARAPDAAADKTAWLGGIGLAVGANLINNLPAGLIAADAIAQQARPPAGVTGALLVGVDLGPNLSITGSLATILWLTALRREGIEVGFWQFLRLGALLTPPALILALAALLLPR